MQEIQQPVDRQALPFFKPASVCRSVNECASTYLFLAADLADRYARSILD